MSLDYTKYYLLTVEDSDRQDLLIDTPRDLTGSYRVDNDTASSQYIYNEDIGVSEWGLKTLMSIETYPELPKIWTACYGTIHDYRYDASDGTEYMEFVREVRSVSGASRYFFVVRCSDPDYIPSQSIVRYLAAWDDTASWAEMEADYEKLILNFCYTNPKPDIYKLYQLPLIRREDWGKFLHINTTFGELEWQLADPNIDPAELLDQLSQISGVPAGSHPVIPCIYNEAFSAGPHTFFSAGISGADGSLSAISAAVMQGGRVSDDTSSLFNAGWVTDSEGYIEYLVFDFPVQVFPEPGDPVTIDIGDCEFKYSLLPDGDVSNQCILNTFTPAAVQSDYIYIPGEKQLILSDTPVTFSGIRGQVMIRPSRLSSVIRSIPFEFRLSLSAEASDDEES